MDEISLFFDDLIDASDLNKTVIYSAYGSYNTIFQYIIYKRNQLKNLFRLTNKINSINVHVDQDNFDLFTFICRYMLDSKDEISVCFINIFGDNEHEISTAHTVLLIFRKSIQTLEYYDPNACTSTKIEIVIDKIYEIFDSIIPEMDFTSSLELHGDNIEQYLKHNLNSFSSSVNKNETDGWCQMWCLFLFDMITYYPHITTKDILSMIFIRIDNKNNREMRVEVNSIIRGYFVTIFEETKNDLENESIFFDMNSLSKFDHKFLYSDRKLFQHIDSYFNTLDVTEF